MKSWQIWLAKDEENDTHSNADVPQNKQKGVKGIEKLWNGVQSGCNGQKARNEAATDDDDDDVNVCVADHTTISITQQHLTDVGGKYFPETK